MTRRMSIAFAIGLAIGLLASFVWVQIIIRAIC